MAWREALATTHFDRMKQPCLIKGGLSSQLVALIVHAWYCQQGEQYPPDLADDRNCEHCHLNH